MTPNDEVYYNNYFDLFNHEGWKQLLEELTINGSSINSIVPVKDVEDLFFRKGQLNIVSSILNLQNTIEASYAEAQESSE